MEFLPTTHSRGALTSSVVLHGIIAFLLIQFVKCEKPDPPIGSLTVEMELAADWGNNDEGMGDTESENPSENPSDTPQPNDNSSSPSESTTPNVSTQTSSTVAVPKGSDDKPVEAPKTSKAGGLIKNNSKNNPAGGDPSDGDKPGVGNTGNENGLIEGKGIFGGKGGGGGWSLFGGKLEVRPTSDLPDEEGRVVLDIGVDKNGNVAEATVNFGQGKTNTSSKALHDLAKKAALTAKFSARTDGQTGKRKGSLTFNYKLS